MNVRRRNGLAEQQDDGREGRELAHHLYGATGFHRGDRRIGQPFKTAGLYAEGQAAPVCGRAYQSCRRGEPVTPSFVRLS